MIVLDTDHLTLLTGPPRTGSSDLFLRLKDSEDQEIVTSIVSVEEVMRGWMAVIARERKVARQIHAYSQLAALFTFFADWLLLPFDARAAAKFEELRSQTRRISASDLKIAAITLVHDALLLTANRRDFERVPGLRFEDWLV